MLDLNYEMHSLMKFTYDNFFECIYKMNQQTHRQQLLHC